MMKKRTALTTHPFCTGAHLLYSQKACAMGGDFSHSPLPKNRDLEVWRRGRVTQPGVNDLGFKPRLC